MSNKSQKPSVLGTIFSAPFLLGLVGVGCMVYGVIDGFKVMQFFFGLCIVAGTTLLYFIRKKDWGAHWEEMDRIREAHEKRMAEEAEKKK